MKKKILFLTLAVSFFVSGALLAQDSFDLEPIVVRPGAQARREGPSPDTHSVQIITREEIKGKNINSLPDLLNYIAGMDLRYRGSFGIQGDLSLRGSTFEQVAVLIDGIKINDPQTGHHNLDIPLTEFDLQRVEVIKEGVSSFYGAGALAGSVNIVTRKPLKNGLVLSGLAGENGLFGNGLSYSIAQKDAVVRVSLDHKTAKAARPNTDFEYGTGSFYAEKEWSNLFSEVLLGFQKKDFGADSFYSNIYPEEEEHTRTLFTKIGLNPKSDRITMKNNIFLRRHLDKFILNRNNPVSVNYHTTYIYGLDSSAQINLSGGRLSLGVETGQDEIFSNSLGKHRRFHQGQSLGFSRQMGRSLSFDINFRLDYYQGWPWQESWNGGIAYKLSERLKLNASLSRAFRIPSFTDLYYSDSANKGNPNLKVETSDAYRAGLCWEDDFLKISLDGFYRRGKNLIDWTRNSDAEPWQVTNLGKTDFQGIELICGVNPEFEFANFKINRVDFTYSYTSASRKASGFFSKYALDILQHRYTLDVYSSVLGINFNWELGYSQRYYANSYFAGNLCVTKKVELADFSFEPFIRIDNFTNKSFSEISGVPLPGRWVKGGVKFEW